MERREEMMFEPLPRLLLGLSTGFLFGVLLQKGRVAKYRVIVGQFLLRDWTVVKVMGTAVIVGAIGVFMMHGLGMVSLHIKPTLLGGVITGGALFGIGMGLLGYCPGTSVAACGEGRKDAIVGVLGQLTGAVVFVAAYGWLEPLVKLGDFGKITLSGVAHTSPWLWIAAMAIVGAVAAYWGGLFRWTAQSSGRASSQDPT
jgi:uncharacterized membrane protein YedE/YeeE